METLLLQQTLILILGDWTIMIQTSQLITLNDRFIRVISSQRLVRISVDHQEKHGTHSKDVR